jgi:cytoskeletal protein RodZ
MMLRNTKKVQNRKSRKRALTLLITLLISGGGIALWWHYHKPAQVSVTNTAASSTINYSPSKPSDNAANNARKTTSTPASTLDNGATTTAPAPFSVSVTRAGVVGSDLQVGTLVNGATSGGCTLNVSQSGQQTVSQTSTIQQQNNAYSCPVFNIPLSIFPNKGNWNVSVVVTSGSESQTGQWQANPVNIGNN